MTENSDMAPPEEFPLRVANGNCGKNRQVQTHTGGKSVGEIILAICCRSFTCMKKTHVGYRQVGYSLGQKGSMPLFLMQVLSDADI